MDLFERLHQLRQRWAIIAPLLIVDAIAMGYGWFYYWDVGQFRPGSVYFEHPLWWPLVADSPNAVLLFFVAVLAAKLWGWRNQWLDALAFILNVYVGLWTSTLFLLYADTMGTWNWGSTNNILFFAHFGMILQALLLVHDLRKDVWSWKPFAGLLGVLTIYILVDYVWPVLHPAPFLHGRDVALHVASPLLMVAALVAFVAVLITARAARRSLLP